MNREISLARVVAHLMGDGCVTKRYMAYYNKNKYLLDNFKVHFSNIFGEVHFIHGKVNSGTSLVQVQNKKILAYLKNLCGDFRSHFLEFPSFVNNFELKSEFIGAIFDDEGCVALRVFRKTGEIKRNLSISSNSLTFLEKIKEILEREFNIKCNRISKYVKKVGEKEFTNYVLGITGKENFIGFREKIRFTHPEKIIKLEKMIDSYIRK